LGDGTMRSADGAPEATVVQQFAGPGFDPGDGASAANAALLGARGIAVQADGTVVLADAEDQRVRRVSKTISTVAGTGDYGLSGDGGTATGAKLAGPE